jgi:hypothetical protein
VSKVLNFGVFAAVLYFSLSTFASRQVGVDGRDGMNGRSGYSGANGQSVVLKADGSNKSLILDGGEGGDAQFAEHGEDAWSCRSGGLPAEDLFGADGGDGGSGGEGGDGGSGGDVTIYYKNASDLKQVFVRSLGGRGGMGASGGRGGRPCYCERRSWTREICRTVKDQNGNPVQECRNVVFNCRDGMYGRDGFSGSRGREGQSGSLTLVKSDSFLEADILRKNLDLATINGAQIVLAKNIFVSKSGASRILAPGSVLSDVYQEFVERKVLTAEVLWQADRPASDFAGQIVSAGFGASEVELRFPAEVWAALTEEVVGNHKEVVIKQALKESEVKNVAFEVSGKGVDTILKIVDKAVQKELLENSLHLKIERDKLLSNPDVYEGVVPEDFISVVDGNLIVAIGKLPVSDKDTFKGGKKIKVFSKLTRSFAGRSALIESLVKYENPKK